MASYILFHLTLWAVMSCVVNGAVNQVPLPTIDLNECWGPIINGTCLQDPTIRSFQVQFTADMISDLRSRLQSHRSFVPPLEGIAFQYGFNSAVLQNWTRYLAQDYPFDKRQAFLNQYPQYKTMIQGLNIHFIRVQSENISSYTDVVPLLILHGWPGSVREFYETIPYLLAASKAKGFAIDIIIASLPGFGFSDGAVRPGMGADKVAIICRNLMNRLGYSKYFLQGGDFGSIIASIIATFFPDEVQGYHMNFALLHTPETLFRIYMGTFYPNETVKPELQDRLYPLTTKLSGLMTAAGYLHIQATKPDTVGIGLTDSPSGLMAYTLEKVSTAVRKKFINYPDGGLTAILTAEQIFDNFMIYWSSNCITTAVRLYSETFNKRFIGLRLNEIRSSVPAWALQAPDEIIYLPPWLIKQKFPNFLNETLPSEGGHFYAWEKPDLYAQDVTNAIVAFRAWHAKNSTLYSTCSLYTDSQF